MGLWHLFTDASVDTRTGVGYGAYLLIDDLTTPAAIDMIQVKRFEHTSSTKLELQTLLWALENSNLTEDREAQITLYTDSQNIVGLPSRREKLERNNYFSSSKKKLNHHLLYQAFFRITSSVNCKFVKISGHQPSSQRDNLAKLFGLVDRASRQAVRNSR